MNVNVQVLCPSCKDCRLFKIDGEDFYANDKLYTRMYYCEHLEVCENAIDMWKKESEKQ